MPAWPIWSDAYLPFLAGQWDILHGWPADESETCINVNLNSSWCIWMHLMHWDEKDQWVSGGWGLKDDSARLEDCSLHSTSRRGNQCSAHLASASCSACFNCIITANAADFWSCFDDALMMMISQKSWSFYSRGERTNVNQCNISSASCTPSESDGIMTIFSTIWRSAF